MDRIDPINFDDSLEQEHVCDACGHPWASDESPLPLAVNGETLLVHDDCAAICCGCSELGIAKSMLRIGAAHWVHYLCVADPKVIREQYLEQQRDEQRDTFNETRR